MEVAARRLAEEVPSMRHTLRNVFRLAIETEETREHVCYVEIYSSGCVRLVKLLRIDRGDPSRLDKYLQDQIDQALQEVNEEWEAGKYITCPGGLEKTDH